MAKTKKTIYRVEGGSQSEPEASSVRPPSGGGFTRGKLLWVVIGVAVLTIAMIVAIAVLGAAESPAVGTDPTSSTSSTVTTATAAVVTSTEPVGASTTSDSQTTTTLAPSSSTTAGKLVHEISDPARIVIPSLEVDAKIVQVGLKSDGSMVVPEVGVVGWYKLGPLPGAAGPSVLVSHVSYNGKKGVFYNLKKMKAGDQFQIYSSSGESALFQVDSLETILKTKLPTERIWNQTDDSVIRLITCGGAYDSKSGHYLSNVIVYGHLVN